MRKLFPPTPRAYVSAAVIGIVITLYVLWQNGFDKLYAYINGLTAAGALLVLFGLLMLVAHFGAFDSFAFAFKKAMEARRRDFPEHLVKQSYWDYLQGKQEERKREDWTFMAYVWVGLLFVAAGFIVEFCAG